MKEKYEKLISFMHDFEYDAHINEYSEEMIIDGTGMCNFYHVDSGSIKGLIVETPDIARGIVGIKRDADKNCTVILIGGMNDKDEYDRVSFIVNSFLMHKYNMEVTPVAIRF